MKLSENCPRINSITAFANLMFQDMDPYIPGYREKALQEQIQQLACYLWDNFLQLYETDEIFLMGVGNAYLGVKVLLINRGTRTETLIDPLLLYSGEKTTNIMVCTDCKSKIAGIVNYVTGNLRPIKSDIDPDLSLWYKENSRVYVAGDHACWSDPDLTKKVQKRRFGTVVRSPKISLNEMMQRHAAEAQQWILSRTSSSASQGDTTEEDEDEVIASSGNSKHKKIP